jgi:hypothetical protein
MNRVEELINISMNRRKCREQKGKGKRRPGKME